MFSNCCRFPSLSYSLKGMDVHYSSVCMYVVVVQCVSKWVGG